MFTVHDDVDVAVIVVTHRNDVCTVHDDVDVAVVVVAVVHQDPQAVVEVVVCGDGTRE